MVLDEVVGLLGEQRTADFALLGAINSCVDTWLVAGEEGALHITMNGVRYVIEGKREPYPHIVITRLPDVVQ